MSIPSYIQKINGKTYCLLDGELDKNSFEFQCKKCDLKSKCKVVREYSKDIPSDWHGLNREALFSGRPDYPKKREGNSYTPEEKEILSKYRDISKVVGLALTYGGSSYTVSDNMGIDIDSAQEVVDSFFKKLPDVKKYILFQHQNLLKTGKSYNLFKRTWDLSRWVFSKSPIEKERRQDLGYAKRVSLNHPIQSTSAEVLKISMIRVNEQIQTQNWSPLYGSVVPKTIQGLSYRDFVCTMLLSIHDEEDFLIRSPDFDLVLPSLYRTLQVRDVIKSLGVDFLLEMDVEFDATRSFTATTKYPSAKVFLLNEIIPNMSQDQTPNILLVNLEDLTPETLHKLTETRESQGTLRVGVKAEHAVFICPCLSSGEELQNLGLKFSRAFLAE